MTDEHIIPRQFGTFATGQPITIKACGTCNSHFCKEFENKSALDSWEGITRFRRNEAGGLRPKQLLYDRLTIQADEPGDWYGSHAVYIHEEGRPAVQAAPQVSFPTVNGEDWVQLKQLRKMEANSLAGKFDSSSKIKVVGPDSEIPVLLQELERLGLPLKIQGQLEPPTDRPWLVQKFAMDHAHLRLICKIAFNYLIAVTGLDVAQSGYFDALRAYIKFGVPPPQQVVTIAGGMERTYETADVSGSNRHLLSVQIVGDALIGLVYLYNDIAYRVVLSRFYRGDRSKLPSAHEYNLDFHTATPIDVGTIAVGLNL